MPQGHLHTHTHQVNGRRSRRIWVCWLPLHLHLTCASSQHRPKHFTSSLTPCHRVLLRQEKGRQCGSGVEGKRKVPWGVIGAMAGFPSCRQPVLKTSTGPHPFFNHQQTPERRDIAAFYVGSRTSVLRTNQKYLSSTCSSITKQTD